MRGGSGRRDQRETRGRAPEERQGRGLSKRADGGVGPCERRGKPLQPPEPAAHSGASAETIPQSEDIRSCGQIKDLVTHLILFLDKNL